MVPPVQCSVPDCDYETPEGTTAQTLEFLKLHTNAVHTQPPAAAQPGPKIERLPRPVFSLKMTESAWQYTEIDWVAYMQVCINRLVYSLKSNLNKKHT